MLRETRIEYPDEASLGSYGSAGGRSYGAPGGDVTAETPGGHRLKVHVSRQAPNFLQSKPWGANEPSRTLSSTYDGGGGLSLSASMPELSRGPSARADDVSGQSVDAFFSDIASRTPTLKRRRITLFLPRGRRRRRTCSRP